MKVFVGGLVSLSLAFGLVAENFAGSPEAFDFSDRTELKTGGHVLPPAPAVRRGQPVGGFIVWDNGGFITHPGAGVDGADVSMASEDQNSAGDNVRKLENNAYFRIADRFELSQKTGLLTLSTFGYEPFVAPPTWTSRNLRIWAGVPGEPGSEVLFEREYSILDVQFTGVYRVLHLENLDDVRRPIYEISWDLAVADSAAPLWLEEGEYWIDWQVVGGVTGWAIYVMQANPEDPDYPVTPLGDALQLRPIGWTANEVSTPFLLFGLSETLFQDRFEGLEPPEANEEFVAP